MENKRFGSVAEMLAKLGNDKELRDEFEELTRGRDLVKTLIAIRCAAGLSQEDIAQRMKCSQSRVSKLENSVDADLRIGDVDDYLDAVGLDSYLTISPQTLTSMDHIKYHAISIKERLEELAGLCEPDDSTSSKAAARAHLVTLVNMMHIVAQSAEKIPYHPDTQLPYFRVDVSPLRALRDMPLFRGLKDRSSDACESSP